MTWIHKKIAEHLTRGFAAVGIEIEPIDLASFKAVRHKRGSEGQRLHSWECRVVARQSRLEGHDKQDDNFRSLYLDDCRGATKTQVLFLVFAVAARQSG